MRLRAIVLDCPESMLQGKGPGGKEGGGGEGVPMG